MNKLKKVRKKAGISQAELSELSGVGMTSLKKYETGKRNLNNAYAGTLYRIAFALNCSIENLIETGREILEMNSIVFVGRKWGDLTREIHDELLANANCVDGSTGNNATSGECIVDLTDILSVAGEIKDDEIIIADDAIIYNPEEGIII